MEPTQEFLAKNVDLGRKVTFFRMHPVLGVRDEVLKAFAATVIECRPVKDDSAAAFWMSPNKPLDRLLLVLDDRESTREAQIFAIEMLKMRVKQATINGEMTLQEHKDFVDWCMERLQRPDVFGVWYAFVTKKVIDFVMMEIANTWDAFPEYKEIPTTVLREFSRDKLDTAFIGCHLLLKLCKVGSIYWRQLPMIYNFAVKSLEFVDGQVVEVSNSVTRLIFELLQRRWDMVRDNDFEHFVGKIPVLKGKALSNMCRCAEKASCYSNFVIPILTNLVNQLSEFNTDVFFCIIRCVLASRENASYEIVDMALKVSDDFLNTGSYTVEQLCEFIRFWNRNGKPKLIQDFLVDRTLYLEIDGDIQGLQSKELSSFHRALATLVPDLHEKLAHEMISLHHLDAKALEDTSLDNTAAVVIRLSTASILHQLLISQVGNIALVELVFELAKKWNGLIQGKHMQATELALFVFYKLLLQQGSEALQHRILPVDLNDLLGFVASTIGFVLSNDGQMVVHEMATAVLGELVNLPELPLVCEGFLTMRPVFYGNETFFLGSVEYSRCLMKMVMRDGDERLAKHLADLSESIKQFKEQKLTKTLPLIAELTGMVRAAENQEMFAQVMSLLDESALMKLSHLQGQYLVPVITLWGDIFRGFGSDDQPPKQIDAVTAIVLVTEIFPVITSFLTTVRDIHMNQPPNDATMSRLLVVMDTIITILTSNSLMCEAFELYGRMSLFENLFAILFDVLMQLHPTVWGPTFYRILIVLCSRFAKLMQQKFAEFFNRIPSIMLEAINSDDEDVRQCILAYLRIDCDKTSGVPLVSHSAMEEIFQVLVEKFVNNRLTSPSVTEILATYLALDRSFLVPFRERLPEVAFQKTSQLHSALERLNGAYSLPEILKSLWRLRLVLFEPVQQKKLIWHKEVIEDVVEDVVEEEKWSDSVDVQELKSPNSSTNASMTDHKVLLENLAKHRHRKMSCDCESFFFESRAFWYPDDSIHRKRMELLIDQYKKRNFVSSSVSERAAKCEEGGAIFEPKFTNCHIHCLEFRSVERSYSELPVRMVQLGVFHSKDTTVLFGVNRVKRFVRDDAHIFCRRDQIVEEIANCLDFMKTVCDVLGLKIEFMLSTIDRNMYIGDPHLWEEATECSRKALTDGGYKFREAPGEAAFYGPTIDCQIEGRIERKLQLATIQLDFQLPRKFNLFYLDSEDKKQIPVVIHLTVSGLLEKLMHTDTD